MYVEELSSIIEDEYDFVLRNIPIYSKRNRLVGEIDLMGIKDDKIDVYEVKCSHRIVKAQKQLKKIKKYYKDKVRNTFFFCGESGALLSV
ncbi:hypothetical protein C0585_08475 [Candidatus Woesearchaeota archaeon]|nr:MAG: hypothetical protein C0585_08475 [Candidatus Woesearchaeota archaeon]